LKDFRNFLTRKVSFNKAHLHYTPSLLWISDCYTLRA
jgi:hypothetical protein